jgi:transglutaminase-like putative cysteine protease
MKRSAFAHLELDVAAPAQLILSVAVAGTDLTEALTVNQNGNWLTAHEVQDQHGTRLHVVDALAGRVVVHYTVEVDGVLPAPEITELDEVRYLRPSRYCESDTLGPTARNLFQGLTGRDLLAAVSSWVGQQLYYVAGASAPTDGAVATMLSRQGVCRDFAHLVVALLRALDVPARLVSVYAAGLYPMDFHAVAEAFVDGDWYAVDATALAPRQTLMRIATGRDASDTAFLSTRGGAVTIHHMEIGAVAEELPRDDVTQMLKLA